MKHIRLVAWGLVLLVGVFYLISFVNKGNERQSSLSPNNGPGGPFVLTSHLGEKVADTAFRGKHMLVYFGYSFCPDVCPLELQKISAALGKLEEEGLDTSPVQPLFISVDPERDTPEALADYVPLFHPRLIGLTGSPNEISEIAKAYKVYFKKQESEDIDGYLMDHLSVIFLMDHDGQYERIYTSQDSYEDIATSLRPLVSQGD